MYAKIKQGKYMISIKGGGVITSAPKNAAEVLHIVATFEKYGKTEKQKYFIKIN